jgi:hypothetical protein
MGAVLLPISIGISARFRRAIATPNPIKPSPRAVAAAHRNLYAR